MNLRSLSENALKLHMLACNFKKWWKNTTNIPLFKHTFFFLRGKVAQIGTKLKNTRQKPRIKMLILSVCCSHCHCIAQDGLLELQACIITSSFLSSEYLNALSVSEFKLFQCQMEGWYGWSSCLKSLEQGTRQANGTPGCWPCTHSSRTRPHRLAGVRGWPGPCRSFLLLVFYFVPYLLVSLFCN